jgi:Flp pilus assembly protein TadB
MKTRNTIVIAASILAIWVLSMSSLNIWFKALGMIAAIGLTWYAVRRRACGSQSDKSAEKD